MLDMKTLQITAKISLLFIVLGFVLHEITNNCSIMKISNPILSNLPQFWPSRIEKIFSNRH